MRFLCSHEGGIFLLSTYLFETRLDSSPLKDGNARRRFSLPLEKPPVFWSKSAHVEHQHDWQRLSSALASPIGAIAFQAANSGNSSALCADFRVFTVLETFDQLDIHDFYTTCTWAMKGPRLTALVVQPRAIEGRMPNSRVSVRALTGTNILRGGV